MGKTIITVVILIIGAFFSYQYMEDTRTNKLAEIQLQKEEKYAMREIERQQQEKEYQQQQAERKRVAFNYAEKAKDKIISETYDGGDNQSIEVIGWEFFENNGSFRMKIKLSWNGTWSGDYYAADGNITLQEDGSDLKWSPTWVNSNVSSYQESKNFWGAAIGSVVLIGALSQEN